MTKAIESGMAKLRIEEAATRKQVPYTVYCIQYTVYCILYAVYCIHTQTHYAPSLMSNFKFFLKICHLLFAKLDYDILSFLCIVDIAKLCSMKINKVA